MINWNEIDTVFIDMDGTLLDLYFDNYIWDEIMPQTYSSIHNVTIDEAKLTIRKYIKRKSGKLNAYCFKYWSRVLGFDLMDIHIQHQDKIKYRPNAENFLKHLNNLRYNVIILTNADRSNLELKLSRTTIYNYVKEIHSAHDFGYAKEQQEFWALINQKISFNPQRTLLIDDNISVLRTAKKFGVKHLLSILQPCSQSTRSNLNEFTQLLDFCEIISEDMP